MRTSIRFAALLALVAAVPTSATPPAPSPAIIGVKADGPKEVVRIVFLGFHVKQQPSAPATLRGRLSYSGRTTWVMLRRHWQGAGAVAEGWVPADYLMDTPRGASGKAVLSLDGGSDGWSFQLGAT